MAGLQGGVVRALAAGALAAGALVTGAVTASTAKRMSAPRPARPTRVLGVDLSSRRIRFAPTPESLLPGRYSFWFAEGRGHARVGAVLRTDPGGVTRELLDVDGGDLTRAREGRFNGWVYLTPAHLGLEHSDVRIQTTQGAVPAWCVRGGDGTRWAVVVHGRASVRQETLRALPALHAAGLSVLLPAYRGDGEAPPNDRPSYGLADAEWVDVESAILHALDEGAREVVLVGYSSGASIVLATAQRSRVKSVVSSVILDSPVLDGAQTLLARGGAMPAPVRQGALTLLSSRWGPRLLGADDLDLDPAGRADPQDLEAPVLVLQSEDDGVAPPEVAHAFAASRPDLVTLVPFTGARHTRLWNLAPERWEAAVAAWLAGDAAALDALSGTPASTARRAGRSRRAAAPRASDRSAAADPT